MRKFSNFVVFFAAALIVCMGALQRIAQASTEYSCEIMSLKGQSFVTNATQIRKPLAEGSILKVGDLIEVDENSHVDVAYDKRWNNITRITGKTKIKIKSIFPIGLSMDHGDVFAKLAKLPKNSTFEIETPTAVAAVRGSEFRTVCENGATEVFNLHNSEVEVFGKGLDGLMDKDGTTLDQNEKTEVKELGEEPAAPEKMSEEEIREQQTESTELNQEIKEVVDEGRLGEIQDLDTVEKEYEVQLEERLEDIKDENPQIDDKGDGPTDSGPTDDGPPDYEPPDPSETFDEISDKVEEEEPCENTPEGCEPEPTTTY